MNSTQYLIILITAVVCFCIYVLAEIVRLHRRENEIRRRPWFEADERQSHGESWESQRFSNLHAALSSDDRLRLQEEIRTRLEGGDGC